MDHQVHDTNGKPFKSGKVEVTVFYCDNGPALQEFIIHVLHSHMTKNPKI